MVGGLVVALGLGASVLAALGAVTAAAAEGAPDASLRGDLQAVARLKVFFGHQSVGGNVLEGLQRLSAAQGGLLSVREAADAALAGPGLAHAYVGTNGDPASKLAAFDRALGPSANVDVALVKLCYVDITERTDVQQLFASYQATVAAVRARHPSLVIVHVTTPLVADQGWLTTTAKRLLGRGAGAIADNQRREAYNELLRKAYQGREPIFDLARLESTRQDGSAERAAYEGAKIPALVPGYTDDGSHLNPVGQDRAARELVRVLAAAVPRAGPQGSP